MSKTDVWGRILAGAAACAYLVACALPFCDNSNPGSGHHQGTHTGLTALFFGWVLYGKSPLLFVSWLSNFLWLAALVGRLACGPARWVRCCAIVGLACAVPAVLPGALPDGYPARYWWFASHLLLAVACWVRPAGMGLVVRDGPDAEPGAAPDPARM